MSVSRMTFRLRICIDKGLFWIAKQLIEMGADVRVCKDYVVGKAGWKGRCRFHQHLIEKGADIHSNEDEALRTSAAKGNIEVMKF